MATDVLRISTGLQSRLIKDLAAAKEPDLHQFLDSIVARTGDALAADACSIYIVDDKVGSDNRRTATMRAAHGYQKYAVDTAQCAVLPAEKVPIQPAEGEKLGLTGWVISTGRSFLAQSPDSLTQHPHWLDKYDELQMPGKKLGLAAFLAVPLRDLRGRVIGVLKAERRRGRGKKAFSVSDQIVLETLARVAGRCIAYVEDAQQGHANAAITSWALDVIAETVAAEGELDAFLDIVVQATAAATNADSCAVFLIDESRQTLTQRAGCGSQVLRKVIRSYKLPDPAQVVECIKAEVCAPLHCCHRSDLPRDQRVGLTAWVAATGKSYHASNRAGLKEHCHHLGRFDEPNFEEAEECGAWLGVPLLVGGTIIGVLKIENIEKRGKPSGRDFTPEAQQRLDVLAQDVALAIRRLQIQSPTRYQVIVNAMPTILEILRGGLTVRELVEKVVEGTARLFNARACALFLKEGNQLIQPLWAAVGWALRGPRVRKYDLVPPDQILENPMDEQKVGLTVWIAVKQEKYTAKSNLELKLHPHHRGTYDEYHFAGDERCESFMGVPLVVGGELVGVLKVETKMREVEGEKEVAYFSEQDELVFELIAKSAAIAIQNARLLEPRRLAELLLSQPRDRVMRELHGFIQDREDVVGTLDATAKEVQPQDPLTTRIIQNVASVLSQDFNVIVLEQLADDQEANSQTLLRCFAAAVRLATFDELCRFQSEHLRRLPAAAVLNPGFYLYDCARAFVDTLERVHADLEQYDQDRAQRAALERGIEFLKGKENDVEKMDLFARSILKRISTHWRGLIEEELERFHEIPNPYVPGMPLDAGSPVFVGREEIFRWIQENLYRQTQKNVLVLHGGWHTGKTSILYQLQGGPLGQRLRKRRQRPIFPVFVDLQRMPDPGTDLFLLGLAEKAQAALQERDVSCRVPPEADFRHAPYRAFDTFLKDVDCLLTQRAQGLLVIMLDEFELLDDRVKAGEIGERIFSYLRSIMQHQPSVTFVLSGRHRLDEMTPAYRDIIFSVALHKEVGFLNAQEAERLIRDPVKPSAVTYEARVVERILNLTGGHPFFIQQLCYTCIDLLNQERRGYEVTERHLDSALEWALEPGNNATLETLWRDVSAEGQVILKTLARLSGEEQAWVALPELLEQSELDEGGLSKSLEELETQQLVIRDMSPEREQERYRYVFDLLRRWVSRRSIQV